MIDHLEGFDVEIVVYEPYVSDQDAEKYGVTLVSLEELFEISDVVSLHSPLLPDTEGMITKKHFNAMKENATFINTARGAIIREDDLIQVLQERDDLTAFLDVTHPAWTTDVNASAYGEYSVRENIDTLVYYTVGTGIGGGSVTNGKFIEGITHPEMGHVSVRRHSDDSFKGNCPSHGDCLEGLASGLAIEERLGISSEDIPASDPYWDIQAYYIAQSAYNARLFLAPEVIVYGGGVMKVEGLLYKVREQFAKLNNDYVSTPTLEQYIVAPKLEDTAATIGCFAMAQALVK